MWSWVKKNWLWLAGGGLAVWLLSNYGGSGGPTVSITKMDANVPSSVAFAIREWAAKYVATNAAYIKSGAIGVEVVTTGGGNLLGLGTTYQANMSVPLPDGSTTTVSVAHDASGWLQPD